MAFEDWQAFSAGPLEIPINGKTYIIPQVSAKVGIDLAIEAEKPAKTTKAANALDSYRPLLSSAVFDQMIKDGVTAEAIQRAALAAHTDYLLGREAAEEFWALGTIPKTLAALAARAGTGTRPRTRSGAASTTRTLASGTGTSTRRNTRTSSKK